MLTRDSVKIYIRTKCTHTSVPTSILVLSFAQTDNYFLTETVVLMTL